MSDRKMNMQDALCRISDAAFGGELAWERMGLASFSQAVAERLRPKPKAITDATVRGFAFGAFLTLTVYTLIGLVVGFIICV